jgi:hypothetical protein
MAEVLPRTVASSEFVSLCAFEKSALTRTTTRDRARLFALERQYLDTLLGP